MAFCPNEAFQENINELVTLLHCNVKRRHSIFILTDNEQEEFIHACFVILIFQNIILLLELCQEILQHFDVMYEIMEDVIATAREEPRN